MFPSISVFKIGGNILDDKAQLSTFLKLFTAYPSPKVLVHGGGKMASQLSEKLGIAPTMHEGRRITDAESLEVCTMVYAGLLNKKVVAQLQANGCSAIGLSGADGNAIKAEKRAPNPVDYGLVGKVTAVNADLINTLIKAGQVPVFCAITHDGNGQLLNTNADTVASGLAVALANTFETHLVYLFEKQGVLKDVEDPSSIIPIIDTKAYGKLKAEKVIFEGMIPKLDNAFSALNDGVNLVKITSIDWLKNPESGSTTLVL